MKMRVLIVDDDIVLGTMLQKWLVREGFEATLCGDVAQTLGTLSKEHFDLIISDLRLPDGDAIVILEHLREKSIDTPFIIITSYGEIGSAVTAMKLGAADYLEKPLNPTILKEKIAQALAPKNGAPKAPAAKKSLSVDGMVTGNSPAAGQMNREIAQVAPTKMSVLILGESGTGKEYAARMIHHLSTRSDKPFIAVDCGSLSRELAASELFGHLKGSFTSASENKTGLFEQADGGTIFMDEVGNLSYDVQMQLLRALQEHKIRPVGSAKDIAVDVRIVAATNEELPAAIAAGTFREDLYHRLNELSIVVPPLRERGDDINLFVQRFVEQANAELDKNVERFTPDAMAALRAHRWSGNLRELRNVVRRAVLFAASNEITAAELPVFNEIKTEDYSLRSSNEKELIEAALRRARGNKTVAAQLLKIDRKTLYNKMHIYHIKL